MDGYQTRALAKIQKGQLVGIWGGRVFKDLKDEEDVNHTIEVHEELLQGPLGRSVTIPDGVNHSCEPNLGVIGPAALYAMRDIEAG